ncbi:uncharacterized protein LOC126882712 [Diabrotica virgifera virgifera]|uniref:Reverse transcriptase domain-containing protein n=1 Tax=Diabrotica virgifera virgifera TaxID=50390 RepID=A0ABM5K0D4_DIAVI|nr:uncharacterized protein LOC126882712 [Diabrotica virgifera virgifera]
MTGIHINFQNCRGLNTKTAEFYKNCLEGNYDVVVAVETWLREDMVDGKLIDTNVFNLLRSDRNQEISGKTKGEGVLMVIKKEHKILKVTKHCSSFEILVADLQINNKLSIKLIGVYIPPDCKLHDYANCFELLQTHITDINNTFIFGDFNIAEIKGTENLDFTNGSAKFKSMIEFLNFNSFLLYNNVKNWQGKTLDQVVASADNINSCKVCQEQLPLVKEDRLHPSLEIQLSFTVSSFRQTDKLVGNRFNFKKANFDLMCDLMRNMTWEAVTEEIEVDKALDIFYSKVLNIFEGSVPQYNIYKNYSNFPKWFTPDIKKLLKQKNNFRKLRHVSIYFNNQFIETRKKLKSLINIEHRKYIRQIEENIENEFNNFWNFINNKNSKSNQTEIFYFGGKEINQSDTANEFAKYFESVYSTDISSYNTNFTNIISNNNVLNLPSITSVDYDNAVKKLKPKKAAEKWKLSSITPIFKAGNKIDIENYRGVAIMCAPSKIFEQILHAHVYNHVKNSINDHQHGFMSGRSINTSFISFTESANNALEKQLQLDVVYMDFEKAFDKVKHDVLLRKLYLISLQIYLHTSIARWTSVNKDRVGLDVQSLIIKEQNYKEDDQVILAEDEDDVRIYD